MDVLKYPMVSMEHGSLEWVYLGETEDTMGNAPESEDVELYNAPHHCSHCSFRCKSKSELSKHVSLKHKELRFACTKCHYKGRTNALLTKHMLKHTNAKPHSCPVCPYKTARRQHLVRHFITLHTGEKPFSCHLCPYKVSRKDKLIVHLRKHEEGKEFPLE